MIRKQKRYYTAYLLIGALLSLLLWQKNAQPLGTVGCVLLVMGGVGLLRLRRRTATPEAAREYEAQQTDERTIYLANKARSLTFAVSVIAQLLLGLFAILVLHEHLLGQVLCWLVCGQCLLFSAIYWYYQRKF